MTHVLVVEDDPSASQMLSMVLQRAGYAITVVATGADALRAVEQNVHIILLDLGLPDMDGLELCRDIRCRSPARNTRSCRCSFGTQDLL